MLSLTAKTKAIIASVAVAGSMAIIGFGIADTPDAQEAKIYLTDKISSERVFTVEEWQAYVAFLDHEIKMRGGVELKNIKNEQDLIERLNSLLE